MLRGIDAVNLTKNTTVEAAVDKFAAEGRMVWRARDNGQVGILGAEGGGERPVVPIDPITGEPIEEPVTTDYFKAGGIVGGAPIHP